ncbi:DUF4097 family beta strand repeat-containing protein [Streptomyces collinus]|uniref:DUF4097 family beta strand repeat-containing protein n=1 Tax=Streptomyces collinus TaxID=42684 RepID=UPI0033C2A3AE
MQKFATTAPVTAVLDIPAGRIQLIAADRADTTVEVRPADAAKNRDLKAAKEIEVSHQDGVLRIHAPEARNRLLGHSGSVEITVQLPAGSRVQAKAADVDVRGVGRLGQVTLEAAQATVKLDEADSADLTVQAGPVTIGRLTGPAEISTLKGDLHITEAVRGALTLRTEYGRITVGAAHGVSATLDAGTTYGRIDNTLRNTDGATAALTIHATTAYGDITARSL